jgi:uncharacterized protein
VLFETTPDEAMTIERYIEMQEELEGLFGRPVHVVRKQLVNNPFRRKHILENRRVIYAA